MTEILSDGTDTPSPADTAKSALKWVVVHKGVKGNERVDEEAKAAAQGDLSPMEELPPILRKQLPYSTAAVKQEHREMLKVKWLGAWKDSPCYTRFQNIDPDFPFNKFQKISDKLSRPQASLLTQMWTGHIPLNSYLHHIKKSDTRRCKSCWGRGQLEITRYSQHNR